MGKIAGSLRQPIKAQDEKTINEIGNCNTEISLSLARYRECKNQLIDLENIIDQRISYAIQLATTLQGYPQDGNPLMPNGSAFSHFHPSYNLSSQFAFAKFFLEPSLYGDNSSFIYNIFVEQSTSYPSIFTRAVNYLLETNSPKLRRLYSNLDDHLNYKRIVHINNPETFTLLSNNIRQQININHRLFENKMVEEIALDTVEKRNAFLKLEDMTGLLTYAEKLGQRSHDYTLAIEVINMICTTYKQELSLNYIEKVEFDPSTRTGKTIREELSQPRIEGYTQQALALQKYMDILNDFFQKLATPSFSDLTFEYQQ